MTEVTAKDGKDGKSATVLVDLGENMADAAERFGEAVVFSNYLANVKIGVQSNIRRYIKAGLDDNAIQAKFEAYKPGVTLDRVVDPTAAIAKQLDGKTPEEMEAFFEALRAKIMGAQG
jgi:hypothetical protein